jgi:predicted GNAT superfamily acetyltransferase
VNADSVAIRDCSGLDEMNACLALQKAVWNFSDAELVPVRLFVVAEKVGGQVIGGFDGHDLVAFILAIPGIRRGHAYLHSHMLAVREDHRDSGLGQRMKWYQRERALERGFELIEWTFDPLEIKNSFFNIEKLGAIARRYHVNQYGITSSPLQGGLPSDRLVAEWWLKSERVLGRLLPEILPRASTSASVRVPAEIYRWKASLSTRQQAVEVQETNRERFLACFAEGLSVVRYECTSRGDGIFQLGAWQESWQY